MYMCVCVYVCMKVNLILSKECRSYLLRVLSQSVNNFLSLLHKVGGGDNFNSYPFQFAIRIYFKGDHRFCKPLNKGIGQNMNN
jgi:hypothetical protein